MPSILVAVDETEGSRRAAAFVDRFFVGTEGDVTAVNVARSPVEGMPPVPYGGIYAWPWPGVSGVERSTDVETIQRVESAGESVAGRQAPRGADIEVVFGETVDAILSAAEDREADLIVVGSNERGFLDRLLGGSVSEDLTRKAERPVLVVP